MFSPFYSPLVQENFVKSEDKCMKKKNVTRIIVALLWLSIFASIAGCADNTLSLYSVEDVYSDAASDESSNEEYS